MRDSKARLLITLALCAAVILGLNVVGVPGLNGNGTRALAVILCTVIAWAIGPAHPASITLIMFGVLMLARVAPPETVFRLWTTPVIWTMVGSFLMARAATSSGLADRLAWWFLSRIGLGFKRLVVAAYVLGVGLSVIIPQPFPRTVLIWTIYRTILERFTSDLAVMRVMCFCVFSSAIPTSMHFLTADSVLNVASAGFAKPPVSWMEWARLMFVPSIIVSGLSCITFLGVFGPTLARLMPGDGSALRWSDGDVKRGPMTTREKRVLAWSLGAAAMWATAGWHGIDPGWVAILCAGALSLPVVGETLTVDDISRGVNWATLVFVVGASAVGSVAASTGIGEALVAPLGRLNLRLGPAGFVLAAAILTMAVHMVVGSALSAVAIAIPLVSAWGSSLGISPTISCLVAYVASTMQWALPFQHVTILVGQNEPGGYGAAETLRFAVPLVFLTLASIVLVFLPWWSMVGGLRTAH